MKKEIPINIVEEDTTRYGTQEEFETYKTIEERETNYKEYAIYAIIILLVIGLLSLFISDGFDIEKERNKILKWEEIKKETIIKEKELLKEKYNKVLIQEKLNSKCIELNSTPWTLADCDILFNNK